MFKGTFFGYVFFSLLLYLVRLCYLKVLSSIYLTEMIRQNLRNILFIVLICFAFHAEGQMQWEETSDWKIYKIPGSLIFKISTDSLKKLNCHVLQVDSMIHFLSVSDLLPDSVNPLWMGGWVATYGYKGGLHKIQISAYAGFFFDQSSGRFYQVPVGLREEWM